MKKIHMNFKRGAHSARRERKALRAAALAALSLAACVSVTASALAPGLWGWGDELLTVKSETGDGAAVDALPDGDESGGELFGFFGDIASWFGVGAARKEDEKAYKEVGGHGALGALGKAALALSLGAQSIVGAAEDDGVSVPGANGADAAGNEAQTDGVIAPERAYTGEVRFADGITLAEFCEFARFAGANDVAYADGVFTAAGGGYDVRAVAGSEYVTSSGRVFWARMPLAEDVGQLFVPVSALARAFGMTAQCDGGEVRLSEQRAIVPADEFYDAEDLYYLSHIIYAESGCEPFAGMAAVGSVVLNRVREEGFPDTVYGVIFDRTYGVQFSPTENGTVWLEPSDDAVAAAKACLEGDTVSDEIKFFFNPAIAESTWISDNREWVMTIAHHEFYS